MRVRIRSIFANCRRYVHEYRKVSPSPFVPRGDVDPPVPDWKLDAWLHGTLPVDDAAHDPQRPSAPAIPHFSTVPTMTASIGKPESTKFGVGRGKVFPSSKAASLLNPARRMVQSPTRLAARLGVPTDSRVLELGCGPGYFSPSLAAVIPSGQLVLADLQRLMLVHARARVEAHGNVRFVQADATRLPLEAATFDAVVIVLMLGEVPDRDACVAECRRVLRSGGVAFFAETRRDGDFIRRNELRSLVEPHGFELDEFHGWSWEYTARFRAC